MNQLKGTTWLAGTTGLLALSAAWRHFRRYSFHGKVVVITGGSRGLGLAIARRLAAESAHVVIAARDASEINRAIEQLRPWGGNPLGIACDVTQQNDVEQMIRVAYSYFGHIDVLINNAGVIQVGPVEVMTPRDYEEAMAVHFWGPLFAMTAVKPCFRVNGGGRIVNIVSIGGKISVPHLVPYSASKFALTGLSEGMRAELKREKVIVTTVHPGLMRTGSPRNATFKGKHRAEYAWFSISDSLPFLSVSAEYAAKRIVEACRAGDAELVISVPAKLAVKAHGLFPGLVMGALSVVAKLLPSAGGIGTRRAKGYESESRLTRSPLTVLTARAARRLNEVA